MLRLLFVTGSLVHGGAERHSITLMNRLAERGHECHAVYVKDDAGQLDRIELHGAGTVHCLNARRYLDLAALRTFVTHLERLRPAVILCSNPFALMYASLTLWRSTLRIPVMVTYHSTRALGLKEQVKMLIDRGFMLMADCLVFVSENQARYWQRRGLVARQIKVIHNGIDARLFQPDQHRAESRLIRSRLGFADTDFLIGMVALLRPEKNHIQLLAAVATLRRQGIAAKALLIGDGSMRATIEATARSLKIERFVEITGYQEDVRPYVAACDVVVLCSFTEALSLAAIEAMAMEKPVVHSYVGGAAEIVLPGYNGYLFPVGDTAALVQRLSLLAERGHAELLGRNARGVAETKFGERRMVDRYEQTLLDLVRHNTAVQASQPRLARQKEWPAIKD